MLPLRSVTRPALADGSPRAQRRGVRPRVPSPPDPPPSAHPGVPATNLRRGGAGQTARAHGPGVPAGSAQMPGATSQGFQGLTGGVSYRPRRAPHRWRRNHHRDQRPAAATMGNRGAPRGATRPAPACQHHPVRPVSPSWPPPVVDHAGCLAAIGETPVAAGDSPHPSTLEIPVTSRPASALTQQARPGRARARSGPRRRGEGSLLDTPGWADGGGSGGEGTRGRPPRRCARGEPSARAGRVTRRSGRITVPISVVFVNLVLPKPGRPRRRRSVVHAAAAAPPAGGRQMPSLPFITWRPCYRRAGRMGIREHRGWL